MPRLWYMTGLLICTLVLSASPVRADDWDLNLARLCMLKVSKAGATSYLDCGGGYDPNTKGAVVQVLPDNGAFRALMSELGVVFAPNILNPADTRGISGFSFNIELGWSGINPTNVSRDPTISKHLNDCAKDTNCTLPSRAKDMDPQLKGDYYYWRAAKSVPDTTFSSGNVRYDQAKNHLLQQGLPAGMAPHVTVMARKGFWFPVPSFEMGVGVRYLIGSRIWAPMATVKVALHEGFQGWPLPAFAIRGSGARLMGTPGFNLTVAGLDFSVSKHLGVASTFNVTPYAGYQLLWIIADSEVLDATPGNDSMSDIIKTENPSEWHACAKERPAGSARCLPGNFAFDDQSNITRHRFFMGIRANFYIATLMLEYTYFAGGGTSDEIKDQLDTKVLNSSVADASGPQHTVSFSIGVDY